MSKLKSFNWILLALLGVAAGASKILQVPQEMAFFQGEMGYGANVIVLFGVLQLVAGVMLVLEKTRLLGAILLAVTLCVSTVIVFMAGKIDFGFISMVPILMTAFVIRDRMKTATVMQ